MHTRGTPPNVIETDGVTWLRLAVGDLGWGEALAGALVRASGQLFPGLARADKTGPAGYHQVRHTTSCSEPARAAG